MKTKQIKIDGYTSPNYRETTATVLEEDLTILIQMWVKSNMDLAALNLALDNKAMAMGCPLATKRMQDHWVSFKK